MLLPTAYLPPIAWCSACWNAPTVVVEANEHYQKGSLRNRAHLAGPNGIQRLSIPLVKGKHQQTPIRAVRISYAEAWQRQHWRTIRTAYGNAPFFEHYAADLQPFYEQRYEFLFDYNLALIEFILIKKMGWKGAIDAGTLEGSAAQPAHRADERAAAAQWVALPSPSGTAPGRKYPQVFEDKHGFIPNLSVLDLLFCCGKRGGEILEASFILE